MSDPKKHRYYVVYWDRLAQGEHLNAMEAVMDRPIQTFSDVLSLRSGAIPDAGDDFDLDDIVILSWVRLQ